MHRPIQMLSTASALVSLLALPANAGPQTAGDTLTPWHTAQLESVSGAEIAPDGSHVAYVVSVPRTPWDEEDGSDRSHLWVLDCASGEARPYVTAESGVRGVQWTPDGEGIAFLAEREGDEHRALWVLPFSGGEARRAVHFDDRAISSYAFAPDGASVALIATAPKGEARDKEEKKGFKQEIYEEDWRAGELWIAAPFADDEPRRIPVDGHLDALEWSPDGSRIAVAVAPTALVDDGYVNRRIAVVDVTSGEVAGRVGNKGKLGSFDWSPDGSALALIAAVDEHDGAAARLMWAPTPSDGATVVPRSMLPERERDENEVAWLADGRLLVLGSQGCWSTLDAYRVDGGAARDGGSILPLEGPVWSSISLSKDRAHAALVGSTPNHPDELFTLEIASGELVRRTDSNPWLASIRLGRQEVVRYTARDGLEVEGVLMRPVDGGEGVPLLVAVHGGPESHRPNGWLTRYSYPGQVAAGRGYAVFYPNYRGGTGRGLAYLKSSQGDPAGKEFDDVVDGVKHLIATGLVDEDRVGVTGGSYGGYATAWCSTYYSEHFAAGVMSVGISNKISKVGTTDIPDEEFYVHALKRPWDDWQFFLERSPIYYADRGKTPLLILHGKDDPRVDPGQSREMYRHLKLRGKAPVRLVHYPGEGHGNRKASARFDFNLRMMRWFDHYLSGPGGEPPAYELDYEAQRGEPVEKAAVEANAPRAGSGGTEESGTRR